MRPPSPSIAEKEFLFAALDQNVRLDGRQFLECRHIDLDFGSELGHVQCSLGKTRVLAQIDAKMVRPEQQRPFEGLITIHCELSPMASTEYEPGRQSEEEIALARMLDKIFKRSDSIDREALCILTGERVWHIRIAVHVLSDSGGGLLDCATLACASALRHFRRPDVESAPVPLAMHHTPFCFSFGFYRPPPPRADHDDGHDDDDHEGGGGVPRVLTSFGAWYFGVGFDPQRELAVVHKAGGLPISPETLMSAVHVAARRARELETWLEARVREDWILKKVEVR
ncbi:ribosomal protein S5 domain 2-like protein [Lactifluus volemus]|nr:ribosomal protein S5 domain 2-like protein [Lactifluus volemus]